MFSFSIFPTQTYTIEIPLSAEEVLLKIRNKTIEPGSENTAHSLFEGVVETGSFKISLIDQSSSLLKQPFPTIYGKMVSGNSSTSSWEIKFIANKLYAFVLLLILINNFYLAAKKGYSWGYYLGMAFFFLIFYGIMFLVNRNHSRNARLQLEELLGLN